jgi:shikimate kinase
MNIYLAGMIGAGKTTVGRCLARQLAWAFDDLDAAMEIQAGKTFHQVVADEGWLGFRQWEYRICKGFALLDRTVVALGGGTVRFDWNRDVLIGTGVKIVLVCDLDEIANRVRSDDRPRVNPGSTLEQDLESIWSQHAAEYLSFADIVYSTDRGKTPEVEASELVALVSERFGLVGSPVSDPAEDLPTGSKCPPAPDCAAGAGPQAASGRSSLEQTGAARDT